MNTETENLVLEHLPRSAPTQERFGMTCRRLCQCVSSMELHLVNIQSDVANFHQRLDTHGDRLARIERRLELADAPA